MKREISCKLDGENVVQTTTVHDDKGKVHSENVSVLGNRDTVLEQAEEQLAEAKRDRDGILSAKTGKPAAPGDGAPGKEVSFYIEGRTLYRVETNRNAAGKLSNQRTSQEGDLSSRRENAEERLKELQTYRDAVAGAK